MTARVATPTATPCSGSPSRPRPASPTDAHGCPRSTLSNATWPPRPARLGSLLELYRDLIALRPALAGAVEMLDAAPGVVAFRRGAHTVMLNTTSEPVVPPPAGAPVVESAADALQGGVAGPACRRRGAARLSHHPSGVRPGAGGALQDRSEEGFETDRDRGDCRDDHYARHRLRVQQRGRWRWRAHAQLVRLQRARWRQRAGHQELQRPGQGALQDPVSASAHRRQPATRADRPPAGRGGRHRRSRRDGRDLDRRVRGGGVDPSLGGPASRPGHRRQARGAA